MKLHQGGCAAMLAVGLFLGGCGGGSGGSSDKTAPLTTAGPSVSGTTNAATTISVTIDEAGTGYYLVLASTAAAPTVEELMSTGTAFDMTANVAADQAVTGLSANTAYTVYFVAEDAAHNAQAAVQSAPVMTTCMDADAAIVAYAFGTTAAPDAIGSYEMLPFDVAAQAAIVNYASVTAIPGSPVTGDVTLSTSATKRTVPSGGWASWSHGYTGPVFFTDAATNTLTLPAGVRAISFFVEPNNGTQAVTVTANSGSSCGPINVVATSGAAGFGFSTTDGSTITSITVTVPAGANGFAVGELAASE